MLHNNIIIICNEVFANCLKIIIAILFSKGLTVRDIDNLSADVFVMSPPCQPFTRYMYFCLDNYYVLPCIFFIKKKTCHIH